MERALKMAENAADQAELFFVETSGFSLAVQDEKPTDMKASIKTGYALRLIKDGKIGAAYTRNLSNPEELIRNALATMIGQVKAGFSFPEKRPLTRVEQYQMGTEETGFPELLGMSKDALGIFHGKVEGQVNCYSGLKIKTRKVINTSGADYEERSSEFYMVPNITFPNTHTSIWDYFDSTGPGMPSESRLQEQLDIYTQSLPERDIGSGRMKVLLMPGAFTGFDWRINAGAHAKRIMNRNSPLTDKLGKQVMSERMTIYNDPLDMSSTGAEGFDDEGVPTKRLDVIKDGVFQGPFNDLDLASRTGIGPTGTGFRHGMWGEDDVHIQPTPYLKHLRIKPGDMTYRSMLEEMDRGIIVFNAIGVHSGNILNGDISMGLNPGLYVENGDIVGRARDTMVAGNMYQMFSNVIGVENKNHKENGIPLPCVLLDDVAVSGK